MKIRIEIDDADAALSEAVLVQAQDDNHNSHGPLTKKRLAEMLLEDVAVAVRRPGSREGANMLRVLESHGYQL